MNGFVRTLITRAPLYLPILLLAPVIAILVYWHVESSELVANQDQLTNYMAQALKNDIAWIDYTSPNDSANNLGELMRSFPNIQGAEIIYNNGIVSRVGAFNPDGEIGVTKVKGENVRAVRFSFTNQKFAPSATLLVYFASSSIVAAVALFFFLFRAQKVRTEYLESNLRDREIESIKIIEASERDKAYRWVSLQTVIDVIRPGFFNTGIVLEMLERINNSDPIYQKPGTFSPSILIERLIEEARPAISGIQNHGCTNGSVYEKAVAYAYPSYYGNIVSVLITIASGLGDGKISIEHSYQLDERGVGNLITRVSNSGAAVNADYLKSIKEIFEGTISAIPTKNVEFLVAYRCAAMMRGAMFINSNSRDWTEFTIQIPVSVATKSAENPVEIFKLNESIQTTSGRVFITGNFPVYVVNQLEIMGFHVTYDESENIKLHDLERYDVVVVYRPSDRDNHLVREHFSSSSSLSIAVRQFEVFCVTGGTNMPVDYSTTENTFGACLDTTLIEKISTVVKLRAEISRLNSCDINALTRK